MHSKATSFGWLAAALLSQLIVPVISAAAPAAPAAPESAANASLEEIVVTAIRRVERLKDAPVSVLAFSQDKMDVQGLKSVDDLARLSRGLNFQRNGVSSSGNYNDEESDINIRGVRPRTIGLTATYRY